MKEKDLRTKIKKALEAKGYFVAVIHQTGYGVIGLPDLVVCADGLFIGIEVKLPGRESRLTERQSRILKAIEGAGGTAEMCTSVDDALSIVYDATHD